MFHLFTHAFFKALLFLAVRQRDARDGRRDRHAAVSRPAPPAAVHAVRRSPWAGLRFRRIFPLSGFFSKDEILGSLKLAAGHARAGASWHWVYYLDLLGGDLDVVHDGVLHRAGPSS